MPAPRHLRHPAPHPPHHHTARVPSPLLPSIRYPLTTLYRIDILDLYICTSHHLLPHILTLPSVALSTLPYSSPPSSPKKFVLPPPKASSNPPVEIFYLKRRRRLILNILPRQHHVDNSVNSHVHSK